MKTKILPILIVCLVLGIGLGTVSQAEEVILQRPEPGPRFWGHSVAISGDAFIAGATERGRDGEIHIFVGNGRGDWEQQAEIISEDFALRDWYGYAVGIDGNTAIVGAYEDGGQGKDQGGGIGEGPGFVYVYVRDGESWAKQTKLGAGDGAPIDRFGNSVDIDEDTIVAGAPFHDAAGENSGSAYIFVRNGNKWEEKAKLIASDGAEGDRFGWEVRVAGDTAIVGSPLDDDAGSKSGSAYVFVRNADGTWTEQAKLTAGDAEKGDNFGVSVDISELAVNAYAIVGAYWSDDAGDKSGSAYIFVRNGDTWTQQAKLTASDAEAKDNFGQSVAIDVNRAIVGSPLDDGKVQTDSGSAYSFLRIGSDWVEQVKVEAKGVLKDDGSDPLTHGDNYGYAVAIEGDFAAVGARWDNVDLATDQGSVYIYDTKEDLKISLSVEPSSSLVTTTLGGIKRSALLQNFPNPFNPETWVPYVLAVDAPVTIAIYNVRGQLMRQLDLGTQQAGSYLSRKNAAYWDGKDQLGHPVSSGIYFYTLKADSFQASRRMVILK